MKSGKKVVVVDITEAHDGTVRFRGAAIKRVSSSLTLRLDMVLGISYPIFRSGSLPGFRIERWGLRKCSSQGNAALADGFLNE